MSTNYYLDAPDNEAGHVGKWAAGHFTAKAPEGVDSFDDWAAILEGRKVFAESGYEIAVAELVEHALERKVGAYHRNARYEQGEFVDRGMLFVRHDFF